MKKNLLSGETPASLKKKLASPEWFFRNVRNLTLATFHKEWLDAIKENDRLVITAFRSSGKTELLLVSYHIWRAFLQPGYMGMVVSDSDQQAREVIQRIRDAVMSSDLLRSMASKEKWSAIEVKFKNSSRVISLPYTNKMRGYHVDVVTLDEGGQCDDNRLFHDALKSTVLAKRGKIVVVGTPKHELDLLNELSKPPFTNIYKWIKTPVWEYDSDGKVTRDNFVERYPDSEILQKDGFYYVVDKQTQEEWGAYKPLEFARELMCEVVDEAGRMFPISLIRSCYDKFQGLEPQTFLSRKRQNKCYVIGLDFGMSDSIEADYSAYTVVEKDLETGHVQLVYAERDKGVEYHVQLDRIVRICKIFNPIKVMTDKGNFGATFCQELKRVHYIPIVEVNFQGQKGKPEIFARLRDCFEQNGITLPTDGALPECEEYMRILVSELSAITKEITVHGNTTFSTTAKHDDTVDSLALAIWGSWGPEGGSDEVLFRGSNKRRKGLFRMV